MLDDVHVRQHCYEGGIGPNPDWKSWWMKRITEHILDKAFRLIRYDGEDINDFCRIEDKHTHGDSEEDEAVKIDRGAITF